MTPNFTHKILSAEIPPPDSAWDKIAAELEKLEGSGFIHKVSEASIDPPSSVWQRVANALEGSSPAKRISINRPWIKWAAAAIAAGLVIFTWINYLNQEKPNLVSGKGNELKNSTNSSTVPPSNGNDASSGGASTTLSPNTQLSDNIGPNTSKKLLSSNRGQTNLRLRHASIESAGIENQNKLAPESEPRVSNNVSSTSTNLIPAPDYYFVTAPNGEKVRISSKFSGAVTSLFGGDNVDYLWKSRFDSWKSKLMTNPSFIPSAGNFLDIAELKDMLKEQ